MIKEGLGTGWPMKGTKNSCALAPVPGRAGTPSSPHPGPSRPHCGPVCAWGWGSHRVTTGLLICLSAHMHTHPFLSTGSECQGWGEFNPENRGGKR